MTQYSIKYVERDLSVDFIAHEVVGIGADGKRLFEVRGSEGDWISGDPTEECEVFLSGTVKWDGCVNFDFPSVEDCMIHRCDRHPDPGYEAGTIFIRPRRGVDRLHTIVEVNREDGMRRYTVLVEERIIDPHPDFVELPPSVLVAQRPNSEEET